MGFLRAIRGDSRVITYLPSNTTDAMAAIHSAQRTGSIAHTACVGWPSSLNSLRTFAATTGTGRLQDKVSVITGGGRQVLWILNSLTAMTVFY